jgi:hypothetical protein
VLPAKGKALPLLVCKKKDKKRGYLKRVSVERAIKTQ